MKKIEILGTGCPKCKKTKKMVEKGVQEAGIEAEIIKVEDVNDITEKGVMMTPAVMVDGETKVEGKVPSVEEIKSWFK